MRIYMDKKEAETPEEYILLEIERLKEENETLKEKIEKAKKDRTARFIFDIIQKNEEEDGIWIVEKREEKIVLKWSTYEEQRKVIEECRKEELEKIKERISNGR